jgi:hypothetical protein
VAGEEGKGEAEADRVTACAEKEAAAEAVSAAEGAVEREGEEERVPSPPPAAEAVGATDGLTLPVIGMQARLELAAGARV